MNLIEMKSKTLRLPAWLSIAIALCIFLGSYRLGAGLGLTAVLAQDSNQIGSVPAGWFLSGSKPANYHTGVDKTVNHHGQPSAYLLLVASETDGFGTLMQSINTENYAGKRIRLQAWVKSQDAAGSAGMWMRDDKEQTSIAFDNMQNRAIKGTQPWGTHSVVLDVPEDATSISFGVLLAGTGEVWVNHVTLEVAGKRNRGHRRQAEFQVALTESSSKP